jgi:hypothetical protein
MWMGDYMMGDVPVPLWRLEMCGAKIFAPLFAAVLSLW